ncbi:MAG: pentapeptide repeat-containing protein [Desmonostoc geniculatum HA4340-LM1]|jgi:uncharacterized protein YjbI with pentapeptide repeats|nr:pentapeptide repeat-containing protein [Desmonostoc geniculatum HA4340-LM1]
MEANKKDIRGHQYKEEVLNKQQYQNCQAGQKLIQKLKIAIFSILFATFMSVANLLSSGLLAALYHVFKSQQLYVIYAIEIAAITLYAMAFLLVIYRGFEAASTIFVVGIIVIGFIIFLVFRETSDNRGIGTWLLVVGMSITLGWLGAIITAFFITISSILWGSNGEFLTVLTYGLSAITLTSFVSEEEPHYGNIIALGAILIIFASAIIARQSIKGSAKFAWIKEKAVFWASTGGTSFYGADLTDTYFDGAHLSYTDFRKANLTRTSFENVKGLEFSRLEGTILENLKLRKLLVTKKGKDEDYTGANFNGANLNNADLTGAILTGINALDVDFSGATLSGACIQEWNINKNTCFTGVKCSHVYLKCTKIGDRIILAERKPDNGEFQDGDFEKWIDNLQDTVDVILRGRFNLQAFGISLAKAATEHEGLNLSRYSIENKGGGIFVGKVGVSPQANKSAIYQTITNYYYNEVSIQGEKAKILLNPSKEVEIMETNNQNINNRDGSIDMSSGNKITARDLTNASLTMAEANSQVSNSIQQLRDISSDSSDDLAKILSILQKSIADDAALSESQKKEALEAVETIAEEGKKPQGERVLKFCSMAVNALKGLTSTVSDASKLAEVLKTHLPALTSILGL